jgi:hypothetical protein
MRGKGKSMKLEHNSPDQIKPHFCIDKPISKLRIYQPPKPKIGKKRFSC